VKKLRDNVAYTRAGIGDAGFVARVADRDLPHHGGRYRAGHRHEQPVAGDGRVRYRLRLPVVPEGTARLRVQISAAHESSHLDLLINSPKGLKAQRG